MEPGGGTAGACAPPQWDPILSFSLTVADPEIRPGGEGGGRLGRGHDLQNSWPCAVAIFLLTSFNTGRGCKLLFPQIMQDAVCFVCWFSRSFVSEACACFWGMFVRGFARRDLC